MKTVLAPFVSVIVVNYNGARWLRNCLKSLQRQDYSRSRLEFIVVDNNSTDGSLELMRQEFPNVRVIASRSNLGFAAGNNAAFAIARGAWLALINNDAVADPSWISQSIAAGGAADDVGGVAAHLVFDHDPTRVNSTGLAIYSDGRAGDRDINDADGQQNRPGGEVFGGCGAAVCLRAAMIRDIGGFDAKLFMYYEDLELAWRARRNGWRFVYAPKARVRHIFGASVGVASAMQVRLIERNRALVQLRHGPVWLAVATVLGLCGRLGRILLRSIVSRNAGPGHFTALIHAIAEVFLRAPTITFARLGTAGGDQLRRRWISRKPIEQNHARAA